jgi:hypothetical protein
MSTIPNGKYVEPRQTILVPWSSFWYAQAEQYLADATRALPDAHRCAELSRQSLYYALHAGEKIELERARATVPRNDRRPHFFLGCDIHAHFQMEVALFLSRFTKVLTALAGTADPRI